MAGRKRASNTELQYRLDALLGLRARGIPSSQLIDVACQQWGVSERQAKRYLQMAKDQALTVIKQPLEFQYGQICLALSYIYQQAIVLGDLNLAQRVATDRMRLLKQLKAELPQAQPSGIMSAKELEALLQSFEDKTKEDESVGS